MRRLHRAVAIVFGVTSLAVGGLTSQASAVEYWVSGPNTCPVAVGTVPNAYCVYKSRTSSSNIQGYYYAGDANFNGNNFAQGGATVNNNNNDNTNGWSFALEICNSTNYLGGVNINLPAYSGIKLTDATSNGSSFRTVTNGCNG